MYAHFYNNREAGLMIKSWVNIRSTCLNPSCGDKRAHPCYQLIGTTDSTHIFLLLNPTIGIQKGVREKNFRLRYIIGSIRWR